MTDNRSRPSESPDRSARPNAHFGQCHLAIRQQPRRAPAAANLADADLQLLHFVDASHAAVKPRFRRRHRQPNQGNQTATGGVGEERAGLPSIAQNEQ